MLPIRNKCEPQTLTARSPAKLIISGEHAVLYGQPALAVAIDRYAATTTTWRDLPNIHFKLLDLAYDQSHSSKALQVLAKNLRHDYTDFLNGKCDIRGVLKQPFELLQYSVANLLEHLDMQLPHGLEIAVDSSIPIGCGMGSSAAVVISALYALTNLLQLDWQRDQYLAFSKEIENLQHGKSSGLDLYLVTHGGYVRFQNGIVLTRPIPNLRLQIVNTGKPTSSTGECVSQVATVFANEPGLAQNFGEITNLIDAAISTNNLQDLKQGIKANHKLLKHTGVVPPKVAALINDIESVGGAAKICGAGAVTGDNAGVVLVLADHAVQDIVQRYGYQLQDVAIDLRGTKIV